MRQAGPVWSPDGKVLACPTRTRARGRPEINVETLDAESGAGRRLNHTPWNDVSRVVWLADGSGVVVAASEAPGAPSQLHLLSYPGGEARRVTNDPNNYVSINGARDSGLFLALNVEENSSVWQIAVGDGAQPATVAVEQRKGVSEVRWGDGGGLAYTIGDGSRTNVWVQDGAAVRQLTFEADNFSPAVSRDRRHVVYGSTRAGTTNIWRMNADGTQPVRLTSGAYEDQPSLTPDGRWVVYRTGNDVRKISIDGGEAVRLFERSALYPALSPDGRLLAYFTNDKPDSKRWVIEIYDLVASARLKRFELPDATNPFNSLRWTPDGRALAFVSNADGASNVWLQPFGGGAPRRLTDFDDAEILSFDWTADGRRLLCVRNTKAYVPVLVRLY
jgi:Tol biopolymer transport system component